MAPSRPLALDRMIREAISRVGKIPGLEITLALDTQPLLITAQSDRLAELLDRLLASALVAVKRFGQMLIAVYPSDDFKTVQIELAHRVPLDLTALAILEECGGMASVEPDATILNFPRSR